MRVTLRWRAGALAIAGVVATPAMALAGSAAAVDPAAPPTGPIEYAADDPTFYEAPNPLPAGEHGDLVRWQTIESSFERNYRIMYLSQTVAGTPTVVTGLVSVPDDVAPFGGFRKLLYGHGSTGLADVCAPSVSIANDNDVTDYDSEFSSLARSGSGSRWVTVATDYEGLGGPGPHPFTVGASEARSMLDAGRAAGQIPGVYLAQTTAIAGFSQGGHAALWAAQLAPEWTPEQTVVAVVAAAPASEPAALASWATPQPDKSALSVGLVAGLATTYPEAAAAIGQVLTPRGVELVQAWDSACFDAPIELSGQGPFVTADPATVEPFASLLVANTAGTVATAAPLLILHFESDERIPIDHSEALRARLCAAGQVVERRVGPGGFHTSAFAALSTDGVAWLTALADGTGTAIATC